ncbi:hypothetical protein GF402_04070 [Candidatus Fermentibacteria bacterium]|nr:hypothetical protein [Candidatus Fermentibacteria bacterium]
MAPRAGPDRSTPVGAHAGGGRKGEGELIYSARPLWVDRMWGSLRRGDKTVGELWWVYQDGEGSASLRSSTGETTTVNALVEDGLLPEMGGRYPLLVKTLHTARRLSVQVHPGKDGGDLCKEETWVVLSARPGSWLLAGLLPRATPEELGRALSEGEIEGLLARLEMEPGQAVHIPPGTVHALGGGLEVLEIQRNCDVTYRLFDWNRMGTDGKPRELHLEKGLRAIRPPGSERPSPVERRESLETGDLYRLERLEGRQEVRMEPGSVLFLEEGRVERYDSGEPPVAGRTWRCLLADKGGGSVELRGVATMARLS